MLKPLVIFLVFILFMVFMGVRSAELPLSLMILFPLSAFPLFYFYRQQKKYLFYCASALTALALLFFTFWYGLPELLLLGAMIGGVLWGWIGHHRHWAEKLAKERELERVVRDDLESFRQKYQSRAESLQRLEKQVSSLMELFDAIRGFSESMAYESLVKLIRERLLPQLPFARMRFFLFEKASSAITDARHFLIEEAAAEEAEVRLDDREAVLLDEALRTQQVVKGMLKMALSGDSVETREYWVFPLTLEGKVVAIVAVEGAAAEDFVRFEVLAANLVLQVKKIRLYDRVRELSIVDDLTGLYVRRYFLERFREEVRRSIRFELPFTVLMLDIDHFKRYNDQFGHLVGDATLKKVAGILRKSLRKVDIVARYGGEEFIAVLPETTAEAAAEVAERIRSGIARNNFKLYDVTTRVTVSLGISQYPKDIPEKKRGEYYPDLEFDLIRFADKALYRAKEEGRNRVYRYEDA
ncbi:MAG: GGDEF domain-containing protein [Candidatus Omnitrophota bacterium]